MPRYRMLAISRPVKGREADYDKWYQNTHLPQVTAIKGFKSGQRFRLVQNMTEMEASTFLAIYEIETNDINGALQTMASSAGTDKLQMSDALDMVGGGAMIYEEIGPVVYHKD